MNVPRRWKPLRSAGSGACCWCAAAQSSDKIRLCKECAWFFLRKVGATGSCDAFVNDIAIAWRPAGPILALSVRHATGYPSSVAPVMAPSRQEC